MSSDTSRLRADTPSALPAGTRLSEFELRGLLGVGGFGIVYLAFDHALEREVAVKEYMPASLAGRTETMHVSLRSQSDAETFALGLKSFVNEARLLARFDHPSLLKVHRFWEANGTAYMAMPVMRGRTVRELRQGMQQPPDEAWLRALLEPLLGAIDKLHTEGVYHRDIAPDNIQVEPDGHPVLLDFGAARRVISDKTQTLTAILKPAYAPIEQYAEVGSVRQGPWTDIYALGATLHYLMLGRPPSPATARAVHDDASALTTQSLPGCSENFLLTVDWMLAPRPADRPASVAALREVLAGRAHPPRRRVDATPQPSQWSSTVILPPAGAAPALSDGLDLNIGHDATVLMPRATAALPEHVPQHEIAAMPEAEPPLEMHASAPMPFRAPPVAASLSAPAAAGRSKLMPAVLGLGALLAVAAFAWWPKSQTAVPLSAQAPPPAVALAASAAAQALTPPPPESTVASVVLPDKPAAALPVVAGAVGATTSTPGKAASDKAAATARRAADTAAKQARAAPAAPAPAPAVVVAAPQPDRSPPVVATPATLQAAAPAEAPVQGPEAQCAGRGAISRFVCIEKACNKSEFKAHPDCLKWRANARRE